MRSYFLGGLLAACTVGLASTASAQAYVSGPAFDEPLNIAPQQDVIVREREYIVRNRPVARPVARAVVPVEVEVERYAAVPVVPPRPYFGPRRWDW